MAADRAAGLITRAEQLADSERGNKRLAEIAAELAKCKVRGSVSKSR